MITVINIQGQVVRLLFYGQDNDDPKLSKLPIWVNKKIAEIVPLSVLGKKSRNEKYG